MPISLNEVYELKHGQELYSMNVPDSQGYPATVRVTGQVKRWKRDPERFKVPVKHGLYDSFYIEPDNRDQWTLDMYESEVDPLGILPKTVEIEVIRMGAWFVVQATTWKAKDAARFARHDGVFVPVWMMDRESLENLIATSPKTLPDDIVETITANHQTYSLRIPSEAYISLARLPEEESGLTLVGELK